MPRRTSHDRLRVFLNSRLVGLLRRETSGAISFQYDRSWLECEPALPASLSLPLREQAYLGAPVLALRKSNFLMVRCARRRFTGTKLMGSARKNTKSSGSSSDREVGVARFVLCVNSFQLAPACLAIISSTIVFARESRRQSRWSTSVIGPTILKCIDQHR
jgi:hypothetical protein